MNVPQTALGLPDRRFVEGKAAATSLVAQDLVDKSGRSFAVVYEGQLLPVRFSGFDEAYSHLQGLGATG